MTTISGLKEQEISATPLFIFECTLTSGDSYYWSTHQVTVNGQEYQARVLKHNLFEMKSLADDATEGASRLSISLANADSVFSAVERQIGWKGAQLTATFLFFDLANGAAASESRVVFRGIANSPDESTETALRLSFANRLNLQRIFLPETQVRKVCPWMFPSNADQRQTAVSGGANGKYSAMYRCGYSADVTGGVGNLSGSTAYTTCDRSRANCAARGMFDKDGSGNTTRRFGGVEFVPPSIVVRSYGESGSHMSNTVDNQARYNDYVPLVYGAGWLQPPIIFARNDGNLTHLEVLLGMGEIAGVVKVVVNEIEIPAGVSGANMTGIGWYNVVSTGVRNGAFNLDFCDSSGNPLGDPYGSMAVLSVVVPTAISNGRSLPSVQVLMQGLKLPRFDSNGDSLDEAFTNNAAWVLLDVLRRSGWRSDEVNLASFAAAAQICDQPIPTVDVHGNPASIPRYQCNLILTNRRSAADAVRGIRNSAGLYVTFDASGKLQIRVEGTVAAQQPIKLDGSNATSALNGGWPTYEFGDNSLSGIVRQGNGRPSLRVWSRTSADAPNRFSVEFQDEFNEYQQDSLMLDDGLDIATTGQEVSTSLAALGLPNFDQAMRAAYLQLCKSTQGNTYVDFETSVRGVTLSPGDIITITYSKEGFVRQPFRIIRIAPASNYQTAAITAQIHDDGWYIASGNAVGSAGRIATARSTLPRPLVGSVLDDFGEEQFAVQELCTLASDGTATVSLSVSFNPPAQPAHTALSVPLVSLSALAETTGGTLLGGRSYYYALTSVDGTGAEGPLSFVVTATTASSTNTNTVTLQSLSFSLSSASFNVYRGETPAELLQIAVGEPIASQFIDAGAPPKLIGPPDGNFDHANFYWRMMLRPQQTANIFSPTTVGASAAGMQANEFAGSTVRISAGTGAGQERAIVSNTDSTLTVTPKWGIIPDGGSQFTIVDPSWQFGATSSTSPISFSVPNRGGATIQISGRAANAHDEECSFDLSPLTDWRISGHGGGGSGVDTDVPGLPSFGLFATGEGGIEVLGIGFANLANTSSINAGTLTVLYWDELQGFPATLSSPLGVGDTSLAASSAGGAEVGDVIQIDSELLVAQSMSADGSVSVMRGAYNTTAANHDAGRAVWLLSRKTFVMPFPRDFFGSNASGSYSYRIVLPDVRIAAAEFFVTNSQGNSDSARRAFTNTLDRGIRTLSGGQFSIQVDGPLAIQTGAAPALIVDASHSVSNVFAFVGGAPVGDAVQLQITLNGQPYCALTVPAGATASNVVGGAGLIPLQANAQIGLDILSVPQGADSLPGSDLTVTIQL